MALETLRVVSIEKSKKQPKQIDHLTEEAPILDAIPFAASTHGTQHAADQLESADAMGFIQTDEPLPDVSATSRLIYYNLAKMGGKITVPEDKAKAYGGKEKYFADRLPKILAMTGMGTERTMVYDNMLQYVIDRHAVVGKNLYSAGGSSNANYSIIAVRFDEGVCSGLYNPDGFGDGVMFDTMPLSGGNLYEDPTTKQTVYGVRLKSDIGFMMAGDRNLAAIVNIDIANNKLPSAMQIDDMLADIRATDSGRTLLLMHTRVKNMIRREYVDDQVQFNPHDDDVPRMVSSWGGVPILSSYNLYDASEANVTVS